MPSARHPVGRNIISATLPPAHSQPPASPPVDRESPGEIHEQTIYIPYDKLREVFEREGRGVFLPYEKFQELWKAAQSATIKPPQIGPPVEAMIVGADNDATIEKEVMVVRGKLSIELLRSGWHRIPIQLADAAILSAKIDGKSARVVPDPSGYALLIEKLDSDKPLIEVAIEYAKAFQKSPGQNSVAFAPPQAPVNRWRIRIPDAGVKLQIHPMLAATESPIGSKKEGNDSNDPQSPFAGTEVLAFVGAAPEVRINWVPKSEGATGLTALASVQSVQQVTIDEGIMRTSAQLQYSISRAELTKLTIKIPASQKIVNVFDPNVRKWSIDDSSKENDVKQKDAQKLIVELFEPATQSQGVTIEMESLHEQKGSVESRIEPIEAVDASRQQGTIAIRINSALRSEPTQRTGLMQIDAAELPESIRGQAWNLAYRFSSVPFEV